MGIFQHKKPEVKKTPQEEASDAVVNYIDETFKDELRTFGRSYFEKIINDTGALFQQDLNTTIGQVNVQLQDHVTKQLDVAIAQVNVELKDRVAKQLEGQFTEYNNEMKQAQEVALRTLTENSEQLQAEYQDLRTTLQKNVADQKVTLTNVFEENKVRIAEMKEAQDMALKSLNDSAQALKDQYAQINATLEKNVADQQQVLVSAFEDNMGRIIEHYLLGALGDQYDLKAQLPSIIHQMEENKQAIVDDMKL
ncbi:MAG: hypothetical protein JWO54_245 [Candidatus Saccharibacteria bacterium]|nr:hypothetical protein [Candidatus Saccharibacteria bacterium]